MSRSKAQDLSDFIKTIVRREITEIAGEQVLTDTVKAQELMRHCERVSVRVASTIAFDAYRRQQLFDIVAYRKPPSIEKRGMKRGGR